MPTTIISLMKQVPVPSQMRMGEDGLMDRTKAKSMINVDCSFALEAGLQLKNALKDAKLIVCSMGPPSFEESLKKALALGYDEAYLLSDRKLGGSDTFATGLALSTMLKHLGFGKGLNEDFILLAGRQTSDGDTAHVPSQVAENLGIPQATFIEDAQYKDGHIIAKRIIEGGYQVLNLPKPCALSLTPTGISPRRPSLAGAMRARKSEITVFSIDDIHLSDEKIGLSGSPTIVAKVANIKSERAPVIMSDGESPEALVESLIQNIKSGKNTLEDIQKKEKVQKEAPNEYKRVDFRDGASGILTWAEVANGKITRPSLELLSPAKSLAKSLGEGTKVKTVLIGHNVEELAKELIAYGSDEVVLVEDERLSEYLILPFASIFAQVIKEHKPEIALFAATTAGRELAPRIGVKTQSGVTADCTALEIGEHINRKEKVIYAPILESRRPTYGESKLATILGFVCPQISTARPGTFEVPNKDENAKGEVIEYKPILEESDFVVKIEKTVRGEGGLANLFEADVIIAGGRGAVVDDLGLIQELTEELKKQGVNAEWAASRPMVDVGVCEYARQVGQTGKTVRPKVYIAVGISGAIQHIAGMKESDTIIAINKNPKETIFSNADFGIVGEYSDIIPQLIEKVKAGFTFGIEKISKRIKTVFEVMSKKYLADNIISMDIKAPRLAKKALPGQFLIVKMNEFGERIPLTVCDYDREKETINIVFQVVGKSTLDMEELEVGDRFEDVVGPLGQSSEFIHEDLEQLKKEHFVFIAGGVGTAPVYPQVKWLSERGISVDVIIGARNKDLLILEKEFRELTPDVHICTDDGSYGFHGNVTQLLEKLVEKDGKKFTHAVAIGPMIMMKFSVLMTKKLGIPTTVSMNPLMVDGTGMCGACRVVIDGEVKFACVDGPEFDGFKVNFDEAQKRLRLRDENLLEDADENEECPIHHEYHTDTTKRANPAVRDSLGRVKNFGEVNLGYTDEDAQHEANRCLECKNPRCVSACPVGVDIPGFIKRLKDKDIAGAAEVLLEHTKLGSICGRVCPQEKQCEGACIVGIKKEPVAIGLLERYVGDWSLVNLKTSESEKNGKKVAVVGSGPAGLAAAAELAKLGYSVEVFESLHKLGGVLTYGIPSFRLPEDIVESEIDRIRRLGVTFHTNVVIGKTLMIDELLDEGFEAVFIGSGAGFPRFMGIKGENALAVLSANEFLTRVNLMKGNEKEYHTPTTIGKKVAVIGAGNVSMDAARVAKRLGVETNIVYRRSAAEIPARAEEVEHAQEEGISLNLLTNPVEILANEEGHVCGLKCVKMELGEPDESGRRAPVEVEGSEFVMDVDTVIMSIGTMPNDLVTASTKGLDTSKKGTISIREGFTGTSRKGVFAGGDIVTGAATVIEAMGAGKKAAKEIDAYIKSK